MTTLARYCGGALLQGVPSEKVTGVSTDTRSISQGDVFVALKGENFNGHDFLEQAAEAGASAVMVCELPKASEKIACAVVRVSDTLRGLQELARNYRNSLDLIVIGITGSSGKTSTKDFLGAVLGERFEVNATKGNLNNHIGLPMTMLRTDRRHGCGVWEMGMSNLEEIEMLAEMASPNVGIITNIGVAHIGFMKGRDAIAVEKGMLAEAVPEGGCVVLSADDDYTGAIKERSIAPVLTAGLDAGEFRAENIQSTIEGCRFDLRIGDKSVEAFIPVSGRHMVANAMLAVATGVHLGLELEEVVAGLRKTQLAGGRLQAVECGEVTYLDDTYNANPESMRAAIDTLVELSCSGKRFAVFGVMAELGESAEKEHRELGEYASQKGIDFVVSVGEAASLIGEGVDGPVYHHFADHRSAADFLKESAAQGDVVLVKGSRSACMEQTIEEVKKS